MGFPTNYRWSAYDTFFVFQGHVQSKTSFSEVFWTKMATKINFLVFSIIVLISVDTNFNMSTIRNYRYKFDTNTMYVYIQRVKDTNHCLCNLLHTCTVAHSKFQIDCTCSFPCMQLSTRSGIAVCIHGWCLVDQFNNSWHPCLGSGISFQAHSIAFRMCVTLTRD